MSTHRQWLWGLFLLGGVSGAVWAGHCWQTRQAALLRSISATEAQLAMSNQQSDQANRRTVRMISHYTCLNYNQARDQAVLRYSQQILTRTQTLIDTIQLLKRQLRVATGRPKLADQLPMQFRHYRAFIQQFVPEDLSLTAPSAMVAGQFDYENLPLTAALATITRLETQLRNDETMLLQLQAQRSGTNSMWFDVIRALAVPNAETVAPGAVYQARLFLAQMGQNDYCNMQMTANGVPLTKRSSLGNRRSSWGGIGMQVQFAVPQLRPEQPDTVRAYWRGVLRTELYPADTTIQLDVPYLIVKRSSR